MYIQHDIYMVYTKDNQWPATERRRESDNLGHPMEQYPSSWPKYCVALIVCQYHS
jgi:hypothetical protein